MERNSLTDSIRAAPSTVAGRRCGKTNLQFAKLFPNSLGTVALVIGLAIQFLLSCLANSMVAAEVGFPLSDPKFPIAVHAHSALKQRQGSFDVYTFRGGCRIYQGSFVASADMAYVWVDLTPSSDDKLPRKIIVQTVGNSEVRWTDEQRLQDDEWMGRLFSHFQVEIHADAWLTSDEPPPSIQWKPVSDRSKQAGVQSAVAWTPQDEASSIQLASQLLIQAQNGPTTSQLVPSSPPRGGFELPPPTTGQGIQVGNNPLGGTVLDAGSVPMFESIHAAPLDNNNMGGPGNGTRANTPVQSFQVPGSPIIDNGPAPLAAPVAIAPDGRPSRQRLGAKRMTFSGRGGVEPQAQIINRPDRGDSVVTISRGIHLMFSDAAAETSSGTLDFGTVLIEADRAVIWTSNLSRLLSRQIDDLPVEVYLEGNVVFVQGQRKIYADRMYYNAQSEYGMILSAEILTPAPKYDGIVRLKADVIQQRSRENFLAYSAALTSSRLGVPRYWLQSDRIDFDDKRNENSSNLFGIPIIGQTGDQTGMRARARHNFVYIEGLPVLYWPILNTNVDTSSFYVNGFRYRNDRIFGNQAFVDFDLYQILGLQGLDGTKWTLSTDYLSKRGFALGTYFTYNVPGFLGSGPTNGYFDAWGLNDRGRDFLGSDRPSLQPEQRTRGRAILQHRQHLTPDSELWAELGYISDRNFLEQYFEKDWDTHKDYSTALRFRQYFDSQMLDIWGQTRVNPFFTETEWLPRLDHYLLGQSLGDIFTYSAHSSIGFARQRIASTPTDPVDAAKFQRAPTEVNAQGLQATTRQEISLPFDTGYYKFVPFLSGEAAYWGQDVAGNDISRLTGQAGLRSSLPMWRVFPDVQSSILNLNGMAHKISFENEFWYADTSKDLNQIPLYDPLDDNSQEHFRRRLVFNTFGGALPAKFESEAYAARQGLQRYVSAGSTEIVSNQLQSRTGIHQRWQTKRGLPGQERIADVVEFDVDALFFAKPNRDNFGQQVGGINYDFRYHIGDRVTLISDGYYDLFKQGLRATTIGSVFSRPGRGDLYFGLTSLEGPISSKLITSSFNYRLNEKWAAVGGTSYDFGKTGNIGQSLGLTRIGESFLIQMGVTIDRGRNNVAFNFNLEPRFLRTRGLGVVGGLPIQPAGQSGLE